MRQWLLTAVSHVGSRGAQKGGLRKRAGRAAEKGSPSACPLPQPSLLCSPPARLNVQTTGPSCSAACPSVQLASPQKIHVFHLSTWPSSPPGPPAFRLVLSVCSNEQSDALSQSSSQLISTDVNEPYQPILTSYNPKQYPGESSKRDFNPVLYETFPWLSLNKSSKSFECFFCQKFYLASKSFMFLNWRKPQKLHTVSSAIAKAIKQLWKSGLTWKSTSNNKVQF